MPTQQEIEEAKRNAQVVDLKNNNLKVNSGSLWNSKKVINKKLGEFTALRDIEIESGYSNPQMDGDNNSNKFDWSKVGEYVKPPNYYETNLPYFPLSKKWSVRKGDTFNVNDVEERKYLQSGYLLKNGTKLYLGKDIEFTSKVKSQEPIMANMEQSTSSTSDKIVSQNDNKLPWIIIGAVVLILVLKN